MLSSLFDAYFLIHTHLTRYQTTKNWTGPNWNKLQMTFESMCKMENNYLKAKKTFWEKGNLLVTSNFSISLNIFFPVWRLLFNSHPFNPLPENQNLEWSKLKQVADDIWKYV